MRAAARVEAAPRAGGGVAYPVLASAPPLSLRPVTGDRLCLVGSAAGPLGGDEVALDLTVRSGARLTVVSAAATIALPGPRPNGTPCWSRWSTRARVAAGASLRWSPEPLVVTAASRHCGHTHLDIAAGACVIWRDITVLGRHDEASGAAWISMTADLDDRPLLRHELRLGPGAPAWNGPAGVADARVIASELHVRPGLAVTPLTSTGAGVFALDGPAALAVALGTDVTTARARLDDVMADMRAPEPGAAA